MISTADFKNGVTLVIDGDLMEIIEFQHVKPGKGGAFVRTKLRNVLTGRVLERTWRAGEKFEEAYIEQQVWQFLYRDGDVYHFMNNRSYDQLAVGTDIVGDGEKWLKENTDATLMFYKGKVMSLRVPFFVELKIAQCDPGVQGDRATGGTKPATLETDAVVQVPLFLQEGETIRVDTRTGEYIGRA